MQHAALHGSALAHTTGEFTNSLSHYIRAFNTKILSNTHGYWMFKQGFRDKCISCVEQQLGKSAYVYPSEIFLYLTIPCWRATLYIYIYINEVVYGVRVNRASIYKTLGAELVTKGTSHGARQLVIFISMQIGEQINSLITTVGSWGTVAWSLT